MSTQSSNSERAQTSSAPVSQHRVLSVNSCCAGLELCECFFRRKETSDALMPLVFFVGNETEVTLIFRPMAVPQFALTLRRSSIHLLKRSTFSTFQEIRNNIASGYIDTNSIGFGGCASTSQHRRTPPGKTCGTLATHDGHCWPEAHGTGAPQCTGPTSIGGS